MHMLAKWFQQWLGRKSYRAQEHRRTLAIEPLEKRSLLSVSLDLTINVTNLPGEGTVPIIGATVYAIFTPRSYDGKSVPASSTHTTTNALGKCNFTFDRGDLPTTPIVTIKVYAQGVYNNGSNQPLGAYEVDRFANINGDPVPSPQGAYVYQTNVNLVNQSNVCTLPIDATARDPENWAHG